MTPLPPGLEPCDPVNRRLFLGQSAHGLGRAAFASLLAGSALAQPPRALAAPAAAASSAGSSHPALGQLPAVHHPARIRRVISLFQSGAPSQLDLFDPKPGLEARRGENLPDSIRQGQRLTTMTSGQATFPVAPSIFKFAQHGQSGMWVTELLPKTASMVDDMCF
ncbi:MAG: DUF1501 domain-containing protein, partial [Planctomycetaceae bacterium]